MSDFFIVATQWSDGPPWWLNAFLHLAMLVLFIKLWKGT